MQSTSFCHQMVKQRLFEILAGVLQGDTLAPYLFIIVLDYVMRMAVRGDKDLLSSQ